MKIALTASLTYPIGGASKGGIGTFVSSLDRALTTRGHEVTVYTVASSVTVGRKIAILEQGSYEPGQAGERREREQAASVKLFNRLAGEAKQYDVIHNNQLTEYSLLKSFSIPNLLTTMHLPTNAKAIETAIGKDKRVTEGNYVALSRFQRQDQRFNWLATIPNGVNLQQFTFRPTAAKNLIWLSRIEPNKGLAEAIDLTAKASVPLTVAGTVWNEQYFQSLKARLHEKLINYIGPVDAITRNQQLGRARALLFPIQWNEPFGLVMIEAMACGTPVITYNRGAASEIVENGVTGFVCPPNDQTAMSLALEKIMNMDETKYQVMRQACRKRVESQFGLEQMVERYEAVYATISKRRQIGY